MISTIVIAVSFLAGFLAPMSIKAIRRILARRRAVLARTSIWAECFPIAMSVYAEDKEGRQALDYLAALVSERHGRTPVKK